MSRSMLSGASARSLLPLALAAAFFFAGQLPDLGAAASSLFSVAATDDAPAPQPVALEVQTLEPEIHEAPGVADRDAILDMIRDHRRSARDTWRQTLADAIYEEAVAAEVDPLMVAAIVAKESSFKSRIVSSAGAVGLMQLRPFVARDLAQRSEMEWNGVETLHHPELNVRLGILYYKELVERFEGDEHTALTAYNYGPTRVSSQLRQGTYRGSEYADQIIDTYGVLHNRRTSPATADRNGSRT